MSRSRNVDEEEKKSKSISKNKTNSAKEKNSRRALPESAQKTVTQRRKIENPSISGPSRLGSTEKIVVKPAVSPKQKKSNSSKSDQPKGRSKTGTDLSKVVAPAVPSQKISKNTTSNSKSSKTITQKTQTQKQGKGSRSDLPVSTQRTGTSPNKVVKPAISGPAAGGMKSSNPVMGQLAKPTDSTPQQLKHSKHCPVKGSQKAGTSRPEISKQATPGSSTSMMAPLSETAMNQSKPGKQQRKIGLKGNLPMHGKSVTVIRGQATTTNTAGRDKAEQTMLANKLAGMLSEGLQETLNRHGITANDITVEVE